jgi:hypothetical protein
VAVTAADRHYVMRQLAEHLASRAIEATKRILRAVAEPTPFHRAPRSPVPDSMPLRPWVMPANLKQAAEAHRWWDARNGRYFLTADVVLEDGTFLRDVTFDTDLQIAVEVGHRPLAEFPVYFGKRVVNLCTVMEPGGHTTNDKRRAAFAERYQRDSGPAAA